jgi:hypothetical protein
VCEAKVSIRTYFRISALIFNQDALTLSRHQIYLVRSHIFSASGQRMPASLLFRRSPQ